MAINNINFESKAMEQIQVELARDVFKGIRGRIEESIMMAISERWEDIFKAVIEAQPAPAVVSNDKLVEELNAYIAHSQNLENILEATEIGIEADKELIANLDMDIQALREENFQLQAALLGASCKLTDCPVRALEKAGELSAEEELSVVEKATMEAMKQVAEMDKPKSMMKEAMEPMTDEEESFFKPQEDDLLGDGMGQPVEEEEEFDPFAAAQVIEEQKDEEEEFDPFAGVTVINEEEVHDALSESEEFDPFNTGSNEEEEFIPQFSDADMPPVPDFEAEEESQSVVDTPAAPSIPATSPMAPSIPAINPLGKNDASMVTYDVFGKEVTMIQKNAMIKSVKNGHVRKMAFQLNDVMAKGNSRYKGSESDKQMGKFYTQMIREWALEIAAANNIEEIKGDSGAAILIAELFYSMHTEHQNLYSPALRFRNETERKQAAESYRMLNNPVTRQACLDLVNVHKGPLALDPMMFVGQKTDTKEKLAQAGYALLHARMSLTWENAMGKTVCVFPEVKKSVLKGGALQ